jgi:hypothetical protein
MNDTLKIALLAIGGSLLVILMIGLIILGNTVAGTGQRMYNCSIAEISPDFTPKMREECRKLRKESQ